jgi:hypothetical protein
MCCQFPSTFIFSTEPSCWHKSCSNKASIQATRRVCYKSRNYLPFSGSWVQPQFLVGSGLLIVLVFCVLLCFLFCLSSSCIVCAQCCTCMECSFLIACIVCAQCCTCLECSFLIACIVCAQCCTCLECSFLIASSVYLQVIDISIWFIVQDIVQFIVILPLCG